MNRDFGEDIKQLNNPRTVRFRDLLAICERHFGPARIRGSHHIFKMPWQGDPRINLQASGKMAKPYQVRDVARALARLEGDDTDE
jgi:predicted RNA binding protein YcfA (HicA-like mRNA interferase family)